MNNLVGNMYSYNLLRFIVILTTFLPFYSGRIILSSSLAVAAEKLSGPDITLSLNTYDRFTELMISKTGDNKDKSKENFSTLFARVSIELEKAEIQACRENGIKRDRYQSIINRIFMVKTYINYREMREKLAEEIKRRDTLTEEDLDREAERSYREMEEWYNRVGGNLTFEDVKKKRDEKMKQYLDSIAEQNHNIEEYNRNLPPNQKFVKLQKEISLRRTKLADPRFRPFYNNIKREVAQLEKIAKRVAVKDNRRKKSKKKPDSLVLTKINEPVETYHASRENDFYTTLMQGVRDQKASGQWRRTVRDNNQKKILELRFSIKELDKLLTDSSLQQAVPDMDIVNSRIDRARLMALSPLPWQDIPRFPQMHGRNF